MEKFLLFILASVGLTQVIIDSKIGEWFRNLMKKLLSEYWYTIFECYMCCGWSSFLICSIPFYFEVSWWTIGVMLSCAFAGSVVSTAYSTVMNFIEALMNTFVVTK